MCNLTMGSSNVAVGYEAGSGYYSINSFQMGGNNIAIGNFAGSGTNDAAAKQTTYILAPTLHAGKWGNLGVSNEFMISNISHFNIPALTSLADGTGILLQYGGANANWVEALGSTYNSVEKIDTIISTIQGQLPAKIIFTTTSTDPPNVTWTVPASVNSVTIKASGSGAPGTPAIATSTSDVYQGGGGGGSGQVGNITIPVAEGMELTISLGAVSPPGNTVAYGTTVEINGI